MEKGILRTEQGFYCYLDQGYYVSLKSLVRKLRTLGTNSKDYYTTYLGGPGVCKTCGNPTRFINITKGYTKYCSYSCTQSCPEYREKVKKGVSQRFVGNPEKRENAIEKFRKSMSLKTDEELNQYKQRRVETVKLKYGEDYLSNRTKNQWERRTQEEIDALVEKVNATKRKNGTSHTPPYKRSMKEITINNKNFKVQGYEDIALTLLSELVDVDVIKTGKEAPRIKLSTGSTYYPDININKLLIEVKSEYTYEVNLEGNLLKQKESIQAGYDHIFLVIHSKDLTKKRVLKDKEKYLKILRKAISSQALLLEEGSTTIP